MDYHQDDTPDWVPDWAPDPASISYVQKCLATSFLIAAAVYISYHVLTGHATYAIRTAAGKGAGS